MTNMNDYMFHCSANGRSETLPFQHALVKLWQASIGWIRPTEWMRYSIDGHEAQVDVDQIVGSPGRFWGSQVLGRGNNILTTDRYSELLEVDEFRSNLFNAHASRFNAVFSALPEGAQPIRFVRAPSEDRRGIPGYRLRRPLTAFLIIGVENPSIPNDDFDWSVFYDQPRGG